MIAWYWLIVAFYFGLFIGLLFNAIGTVAKQSDAHIEAAETTIKGELTQ